MTTQTVQGTKIIRRYTNRKLYDTESSNYTTLKEIVSFITSGRQVQVVENHTNIDITGKTLVMALVETEQNLDGQTEILTNILKAGGLTKYVAGLSRGAQG